MSCGKHGWWFDGTCPSCDMEAHEWKTWPPEVDDIPDFLLRSLSGSSQCSSFVAASSAVAERRVLPLSEWTDETLAKAAENSETTVLDRQPIYRELWRREDLKKARDRIVKMKAALGKQ